MNVVKASSTPSTAVRRGPGVFAVLRADTVEFRCDCCVCLGYMILEGRVPAKENQGRDDQNFSQ